MLGRKLQVVVVSRAVREGVSGGSWRGWRDEPCVWRGRQTVTAAEGGMCSEEVRGTCAEPQGWTELSVAFGGIARSAFDF